MDMGIEKYCLMEEKHKDGRKVEKLWENIYEIIFIIYFQLMIWWWPTWGVIREGRAYLSKSVLGV